MSQKPATSVPAPVRVSGGVPWWLWLVLVVFGASIVATIVRKSIPEDPSMYFQQGMRALAAGDVIAAEKIIQKLNSYPELSSRRKLLQGIMHLGKASPLLAIPLLQEASEDPGIRVRALSQLGNAYLRAGQRGNCITAYETVLKEDENADNVRLGLANVFKEILSWDDSLKHLKILRDRNFGLSIVENLIAEMQLEMGQFSEAAVAFEAAIRADPTDATNSQKALGLVRCKIETGDLKGLEEFKSLLDSEAFLNSVSALELSENNELDQSLVDIGTILNQNPGNVFANRIYAQIVIKTGSKEKAVEALKSLRKPLEHNSRNVRLFDDVAKLATLAEAEVLASVLQENVDQLRDLERQFFSKLNDVVKTRDDTKSRFELGDLAAETGQPQFALKCYQSATFIDNTLESAVNAKINEYVVNPLPLLSMDDAYNRFETNVVADESPKKSEPDNSAKSETDAADPDDAVKPDDPAADDSTNVPDLSNAPKPD